MINYIGQKPPKIQYLSVTISIMGNNKVVLFSVIHKAQNKIGTLFYNNKIPLGTSEQSTKENNFKIDSPIIVKLKYITDTGENIIESFPLNVRNING